jgi:hypothetical protein
MVVTTERHRSGRTQAAAPTNVTAEATAHSTETEAASQLVVKESAHRTGAQLVRLQTLCSLMRE